MLSRTLRSVSSAPNLRQRAAGSALSAVSTPPPPVPKLPSTYIRTAHLHQSAKATKPSNLLTNNSKYMSLSVAALRAECKKRGVKVGGRKAELVDRLMSVDASQRVQTISTTAKKQAKGDDSSIDYYKVPHPEPEKYKPAFKVPVLPDSAGASSKEVPQPEFNTSAPDHGVADHVEGKVSGTKDAPKVHVPGSTEEGIGEDESPLESSSGGTSSGSGEFSSGDKTFLVGFAVAVTAWWFLPFGSKKKKKPTPE
ncbi:hypothetical protein AWJ20_280 [Sugiyamaella lignohabitans]|uniref:SAP domain-containing protein n=1 Tax=Sugiyamaella lignohabitans TaxID=796027 RepID=A0A161HI42_9ASCO|nr:uncharacterized protein AWJ20_280 [Sugiyamaella lignohabitans]ANB12047.1 hypothetical protein AWJ20_280 [Sugiyamaella lignohabitans]